MIQTVEAVIDSSGKVRLPDDLRLPSGHRAIVTVLDELSLADVSETMILSESSISVDWLKDEEETAWSHLQSEQ